MFITDRHSSVLSGRAAEEGVEKRLLARRYILRNRSTASRLHSSWRKGASGDSDISEPSQMRRNKNWPVSRYYCIVSVSDHDNMSFVESSEVIVIFGVTRARV